LDILDTFNFGDDIFHNIDMDTFAFRGDQGLDGSRKDSGYGSNGHNETE